MAPEVWDRFQRGRVLAVQTYEDLGWAWKLALAVGMAGFVALTAQLSVPLPWTPVPFSFGLVGVLLTGAVLGPAWGLLSIALYILAGAVGLHVFADQTSPGPAVLTGYTAGYIYGYAAAAVLVGSYMRRPRTTLPRAWSLGLGAGVGLVGAFALASLTWIAFSGGRFHSGWSSTQSYLWLFVGMSALATIACWWLLRRAHGSPAQRLDLFLVMVAAIAVIHLCGVAVLKPVLGYPWNEAIALGSTVFLPFDLVKAGLATAAASVFLPTPSTVPELTP
jgi:biotin transport system substrate-specific component